MKKARRLPRFKSDQEAAEFWDSHSIAPYWHLLKPVKVAFRKPLRHYVRLPDGTRIRFLRKRQGLTILDLERLTGRGRRSRPTRASL